MTRPYLALAFLVACGAPVAEGPADTGKPPDTGSGDTSDTAADDSGAETGGETGETGADSGKDTADTGKDTGKDTADSGKDTADTGKDTADSGKDTADTADTGGSTTCTDVDLLLTAEVRDSAGVAGTSFGPRDSLSMVAVLSNPCAADITVTTSSNCLFTGWSVEDSRGTASGVAVACRPVITTWTVAAGGSLEESQSWGTLRVDGYVLTVTADVPASSAAIKFSVI